MSRWFSNQRQNLRASSGLWESLQPQLGRQDVAPVWQRLFGFRWAVLRLTNRSLTIAAAFGMLAAVAVVYVAVSDSASFSGTDSRKPGDGFGVSQEQWQGLAGSEENSDSINPSATRPAVAQATTTPAPVRASATASASSGLGIPGVPGAPGLPGRRGVITLSDGGGEYWLIDPSSQSGGPLITATPFPITREQAEALLPYAIPDSGYGISPDQYEQLLERLMRGDWRELQNLNVPLNLTFFQNYGVNPFVDTSAEPISTFSMDVDTAAYTIGRGYLESGLIPPPASVRVEEYINYFDQDYPSAVDALDGHIEGALSPYSDDGRYLLRVGVNARDIDPIERKPANIVLVIDTSGSMSQGNRIRLVQNGVSALINRLQEDDTIGIVTYSNDATLRIRPTSDLNEARAVISRLRTNGGTNVQAGLRLGFTLAEGAFSAEKNNHVILLSDGVANIGTTEAGSLLDDIKEFARDGIFLSTIGVGLGNFNDVLLEQLADNGDGSYAYIDNAQEARKVLGTDITGLLEVVARDAKIQLEFDPETVESYRLVGYENRSLETEEFRDDSVDAGEIGAGHTVTAMYELKLLDTAAEKLGTVRLRWLDPETGSPVEKERDIVRSDVERSFDSASPRFRFTSSVMAVAEILRRSPWFAEVDVLNVVSTLAGAAADLGTATEERELLSLLNRAMELGVFSNE